MCCLLQMDTCLVKMLIWRQLFILGASKMGEVRAMTKDLAVLQSELIIAKQQNEILELKYQLHVKQAEKASRLEDSLFAPELYQHYQKVAVTLSKSGVIPAIYKGKPEDIFVAMAMGYQLGFPVEQSLQDIAVVNGRPCLWGDGLLSLALSHPQCESIEEEPILNKNDVVGYLCTVKRKGHKPHSQRFTLQDATAAGLLKKGGAWSSYPGRMLQMRARSLAIRDKFADALRGIRIAEIEQEDSRIFDAEIISQKPDNSTDQVAKLKSILREQENHVQGNNESATVSEPIVSEHNGLSSGETLNEDNTGTLGNGRAYNTGRDDIAISDEQIDLIQTVMYEKGFSDERIKKALASHKVEQLEQLTDAQARVLILQLGKV